MQIHPVKANKDPRLDAFGTGKAAVSRMRRMITGKEVILTAESIDALAIVSSASKPMRRQHNIRRIRPQVDNIEPSNGLFDTDIEFHGLDPFSVMPETVGEPVPKKLLIRYYIERRAPWLIFLDNGLKPDRSRLAWLPFALAFFYATLLTTATIKHANENMNDPEKSSTDEMIMVALILLAFNIGGAVVDEYEIHLRAIDQMINVRGGIEKLGMRGMPNNWLVIARRPGRDGWEDGMFK
ncbi:hypothetical protein WAI453_010545 [Rhynchosporium graminicola]